MFYIVKDDMICQTDRKGFDDAKEAIAALPINIWNEDSVFQMDYGIWRSVGNIHFCRLESYAEYLYGTFRIPPHSEEEKNVDFALFLGKGRLFLLGDEKELDEYIGQVSDKGKCDEYTLERFFYDFLVNLLQKDLEFLEGIEGEIAEIEEEVLKSKTRYFNSHMLRIKKQIGKFYHYYHQLVEVGQELIGNDAGLFAEEDITLFDMYSERVERLADETQSLREYAMQVQEVYQSEIEIRQNAVMKVLTIVTTIFLPLSLIAGWYGMNFEYMPELKMKYAYPAVIGVSVMVVVVCLVIFKRKNFW